MTTQAMLDAAFARRKRRHPNTEQKVPDTATGPVRSEENHDGERRIKDDALFLNLHLRSYPEDGLRGAVAALAAEQPLSPPGRLYQSHTHLLLEGGRYWPGEEAILHEQLPARERRAKPKAWPYDIERGNQCYESAVELAARRLGYEYVEGWALAEVPVEDGSGRTTFVIAHHGWNYDPRKEVVVDAHWPEVALEYLGIVFPFEYVLGATDKTGWFGILGNDEENGFDLLTRGVPGVDYISSRKEGGK